MASTDETCLVNNWVQEASFEMQPPGKGSDVEIHQVGKDCHRGVYEVAASTNSGLQERLESKLAERSHDARFDSLTAITLATQQQILLFRRKIRLLTLLFCVSLPDSCSQPGFDSHDNDICKNLQFESTHFHTR